MGAVAGLLPYQNRTADLFSGRLTGFGPSGSEDITVSLALTARPRCPQTREERAECANATLRVAHSTKN